MKHLVGKMLAALAVRRASFGGLLQSDPAEAEAIAREFGLSGAALAAVEHGGETALRLQERMLAAFGVGRNELPVRELAQLRDMGVTCSNCGAKRRCEGELDRDTARENAGEFCPNAAAIEALARDYGGLQSAP